MAYKLSKLAEELDAALNRKLDEHARSPDLVAKFLRLTGAAHSEEAIISLAASIVEEHLEEGEYPELENYAEAIRSYCSSMKRGHEEELEEVLPDRALGEPEDKWLIMAAEILAVKVGTFCRDEGLIAVEKGDQD